MKGRNRAGTQCATTVLSCMHYEE